MLNDDTAPDTVKKTCLTDRFAERQGIALDRAMIRYRWLDNSRMPTPCSLTARKPDGHPGLVLQVDERRESALGWAGLRHC